MSALTQQLEQLKQQQHELEERIQKEKEIKQKLENESSIERLETLVQPLTNMLERKSHHGLNGNTPIYGKSTREQHTEKYENEMRAYNNLLIRNPPTIYNKHNYCEPQKNQRLLEEEIYTTIISIFKKQQQEISELQEGFNKISKIPLIKNFNKKNFK